MGLLNPFGHLQHKSWQKERSGNGNQTCSLTSDHKKLGIDPIFVRVSGVRYAIEKFSMRVATLF
jgi:hypothetical protein